MLPTCFGASLDRLSAAVAAIRPDAVLAVGEAGGRASRAAPLVATNGIRVGAL